jgi:hypothetical protein
VEMRFLLLGVFAAGSLAASAQPLAETVEGAGSIYGNRLSHILKNWSFTRFDSEGAPPLTLTCIATAHDEKYVGMLQRMTIRAGIAAIENILDDVEHYRDLFPDTVDVQVVPGSHHGNQYVTAWEQRVPVFFLPNATYELAYIVEKTAPVRAAYRYSLRRGSSLIASDGLVVLETIGPDTTQFTEYDFFNARWGPLPTAVVWRESLRGAFLSDVAIKLKAEHPGWSYERIASEARSLIASEDERIEKCFAERLDATTIP